MPGAWKPARHAPFDLGFELNRTNGNCSALLLNEVGKWSCFSVPENNFLFF